MLYHRVLERHPEHESAVYLVGVCHLQRGQPEMAIPFIQRAIALRPGFAQAHARLGAAFNRLRRYRDAIPHFEAALAIQPRSADVLKNLGDALAAEGRHVEARGRYEAALAIQPDFAEAHYNLGNSLTALGQTEKAAEHYAQAVALAPANAAARYNLATALAALNRHADAVVQYEHALQIDPTYPDAAWNRSLSLLSLGRFRDGFHAYESRWTRPTAVAMPDHNRPLWLGHENVAGRTLLIQHEQGYGDAIQMLRYVPELVRRGARCIIQTPPALEAVVRRSFPDAHVVPLGVCPADVDVRIPLMSLPLAMRTFDESDIPATVPYLTADRARAAQWARRLSAGVTPRDAGNLGGTRVRTVGLVWRGLGTHLNDRNRSLALDTLIPLLDRSDVQFVTLQKQLTSSESRQLARYDNVLALDVELGSFDDTAAVMTALDLVISVDSAPAHLAGALARPTWVLLPFSADWRWQVARGDSPWYHTVRLFRQISAGDWAAVVGQVVSALDGRASDVS